MLSKDNLMIVLALLLQSPELNGSADGCADTLKGCCFGFDD